MAVKTAALLAALKAGPKAYKWAALTAASKVVSKETL
jgi:hypothetical protein